ncbi:MAG TPA: DmsC/YnfH family molybdoenzyme membrane anchor subunit [Vicinamibacterales bacterium]|jgi:DMSO reductase anchor subunit
MNDTRSARRTAATPFHEWPLVVFTTLAIVGAGLLATPLLAALAAGTPAPAFAALPWGALLLGAGLVVSLAHLGRPLRAPLAARRLGRSRLSAEIVLASLTLIVGIVAASLPYVSPLLDLSAAVLALAFLASLGLVYNLPGQQTWRGAVVWMPLSAGIGFGAVTLCGMWDGAIVTVGGIAAIVLAADTVLFILRRFALVWSSTPIVPVDAALFANRQWLLAARFTLVDILPGLLLFADLPRGAAGLLAVGILLDRLMFYGFASQQTTEREIAQAEAMI